MLMSLRHARQRARRGSSCMCAPEQNMLQAFAAGRRHMRARRVRGAAAHKPRQRGAYTPVCHLMFDPIWRRTLSMLPPAAAASVAICCRARRAIIDARHSRRDAARRAARSALPRLTRFTPQVPIIFRMRRGGCACRKIRHHCAVSRRQHATRTRHAMPLTRRASHDKQQQAKRCRA